MKRLSQSQHFIPDLYELDDHDCDWPLKSLAPPYANLTYRKKCRTTADHDEREMCLRMQYVIGTLPRSLFEYWSTFFTSFSI